MQQSMDKTSRLYGTIASLLVAAIALIGLLTTVGVDPKITVSAIITSSAMIVVYLFQRDQFHSLRQERLAERDERKRQAEAHSAELKRAGDEQVRATEISMRALHVELVKIAIDRPSLAKAWTGFEHMGAEEAQVMLYENLILQHHLLAQSLNSLSASEMTNHLRVLVANSNFQKFWLELAPIRRLLDPHGSDTALDKRINRLIAEHQRSTGQSAA